MTAKSFHVGDVLSVTTGWLVSPQGMKGVYGILNHMTGDDLFTHQLPRAAQACAPYLLEDHPWAKEAGNDLITLLDSTGNPEMVGAIRDFLVRLTLKMGCSDVNVLPLPPQRWLQINPLQELVGMVDEKRVIAAVHTPEDTRP